MFLIYLMYRQIGHKLQFKGILIYPPIWWDGMRVFFMAQHSGKTSRCHQQETSGLIPSGKLTVCYLKNDHLVRWFTHKRWVDFPHFFVCLPALASAELLSVYRLMLFRKDWHSARVGIAHDWSKSKCWCVNNIAQEQWWISQAHNIIDI